MNGAEASGTFALDDVSKDMLFLILAELENYPQLAQAFESLKACAESQHLLPRRLGLDGSSTSSTYKQARVMYPSVGAVGGSLLERLRGLMDAVGSSSLLDSRVLVGDRHRASLPLLVSVLSAPRLTILDYVVNARSMGLLPTTVGGRGLELATVQHACPWNHFFTVRGHSMAAYCAVYDKTGDLIFTGSDDRLVKIWSARTGLLLKSCRGHLHEIADLSVSCDNKMLASASIDGVIRLWNIEGYRSGYSSEVAGSPSPTQGIDEHRFGRLVGTLESHGCLISSLVFSPTCPHELLSAAFDGTCRVWDVRDGSHLVLGWDWASEEEGTRVRTTSNRSLRHASNDNAGGASNHIDLSDGIGPGADREEAEADAESNRSISTAVYSNDGRLVVAGVANGNMCVWKREETSNISDDLGFSPVELIQGRHGSDVYLLNMSHGGDQLASASRDGMVCIWKLRKRDRKRGPQETWKIETSFVAPEREEQQAGRRRREETPRADQVTWNADDSLVLASTHTFEVVVYSVTRGSIVTRLSGVHTEPVHVIICHPFEPRLAMTASYSGEVALWDLRDGVPIKIFYSVDCRPDGRKWPDPIPYVDGYWGPDGHQVTLSDAAGQLHVIAVGTPDGWIERTPYDQYLSNDYDEFFVDDEGVVRSVESNQPADAVDPSEVLCDATATPYPHGFQIAYRNQSLMSSPWAEVRWIEPGQQPGYVMNSPTLTAAHWRAYVTGSGNDSQVTQAVNRAQLRMQEHERRLDMPAESHRGQERSQASRGPRVGAVEGPATGPSSRAFHWIEGDELSDDEEDQEYQDGGRRRRGSRAQLPARQSTRIALRRNADDGSEDMVPDRERQQLERERRLRRREQARERGTGGSRRSSRAQRAQRRDHQVRFRIDSDDEEEFGPGHDETSEEDVSLVEEYDEYDSEDGAGTSRRSTRHRVAEPSRRGDRKRTRVQRDGQPEPAPREVGSFIWLMSHVKLSGMYVPQVGDEVVYIKRGHMAALEETNDPTPTCMDDLRDAEPCTVKRVTYFIARDGTDGTGVSLLLRRVRDGGRGDEDVHEDGNDDEDGGDQEVDASSHEFAVNVYSPQAGLPDFLILRSLFDLSAATAWREGDPCKAMFWNEDHEEWYEGCIVEDALDDFHTVSDAYQEAAQLWERFRVKFEGGESSCHSPWELRPPDAGENEVDGGDLDEETVSRVRHAIFEAAKKLDWDIFQVAPLRDEAYESHRVVVEFYNQLVPLPIGLMDIQTRLDNHYYRRQDALAHDISLIAKNAVSFNGDDHDVSKAAKKLCRFLTAVLDGSASAEDVETFAAPSDDEDDEGGGYGAGASGSRHGRDRRQPRRTQIVPVATRRSTRERRPVTPLSIRHAPRRDRNPPRRSTRRRGETGPAPRYLDHDPEEFEPAEEEDDPEDGDGWESESESEQDQRQTPRPLRSSSRATPPSTRTTRIRLRH